MNSDASEVIRVRTLTPPEVDFECAPPEAVTIENQNPKEGKMGIGQTFTAAGFQIFLVEVENHGNGQISGLGWASIPAFQGLQIVVEFDQITLNTDNQLIAGKVYSSYNEDNLYKFADSHTFDEPIDIEIKGNKIIIKSGEGKLELLLGEKYVLEDPNYIYKVDEEGNVKKEPKGEEEEDYSDLSPEELLEKAKELEEEADEVKRSGNPAKAIKLLEKADKLRKRAQELLAQLVKVASVILKAVKELIDETNVETSLQGLEEVNGQLSNKMYEEQGLGDDVETAPNEGVSMILFNTEEKSSPNEAFGELVEQHAQKKYTVTVGQLLDILLRVYLSEEAIQDNFLEDVILDGKTLLDNLIAQEEANTDKREMIDFTKAYIVEKIQALVFQILYETQEEE